MENLKKSYEQNKESNIEIFGEAVQNFWMNKQQGAISSKREREKVES